MIHHADFALQTQDETARRAYMRSLSHQTRFLSRRWTSAAPGLPGSRRFVRWSVPR